MHIHFLLQSKIRKNPINPIKNCYDDNSKNKKGFKMDVFMYIFLGIIVLSIFFGGGNDSNSESGGGGCGGCGGG